MEAQSASKRHETEPGFWDFGEEKELKWHRIHAYPAKFPAFITGKAVKFAESRGIRVKKVADIFCGCGTTAFEARRLNLDFWGCDINPVATLIARVKSATYQKGRLGRYFDEVAKRFERLQKAEIQPITDERIRYWFSDSQIDDLNSLRLAIQTLPSGKYQDFFFCAFSNILKPSSRWLTKSIKPQIDPKKKEQKPWELFRAQVNNMLKALDELEENTEVPDIKIKTTNLLAASTGEICADLIVTSPPYVTSYEYADLHQLSTLWLEYTDDYRKLRNGTIGSLYNDSNVTSDFKSLNKIGSSIAFRLFNVDKRKAAASARYFLDLDRTVRQSKTALRKGGMLLFVIGDTEYKGVRIENSEYLLSCLEEAGFRDIHISKRKISRKILTPYRDARGCFSTKSTDRKVYAEEFIISATRP